MEAAEAKPPVAAWAVLVCPGGPPITGPPIYGFCLADAFGGGGETRVVPPNGLNEGDCIAGDMLPDDIEPPTDGPAVCLHPMKNIELTAKTSVARDSLRMTKHLNGKDGDVVGIIFLVL